MGKSFPTTHRVPARRTGSSKKSINCCKTSPHRSDEKTDYPADPGLSERAVRRRAESRTGSAERQQFMVHGIDTRSANLHQIRLQPPDVRTDDALDQAEQATSEHPAGALHRRPGRTEPTYRTGRSKRQPALGQTVAVRLGCVRHPRRRGTVHLVHR